MRTYGRKALLKDFFSLLFPKTDGRPVNHLIPGEILGDSFAKELQKLAKNSSLKTYLEIGSSSGEGSTKNLIDGINSREDKEECLLVCLEVSRSRFLALNSHFNHFMFFKSFQLSSVSISSYPSWFKVVSFYFRRKTNLNQYSLISVLSWLRKEKNYLRSCGIDLTLSGIDESKKLLEEDRFDVVLIDGSEFTGFVELMKIWGARYICLDDTNSFKNFDSFKALSRSTEYELIASSKDLRNGFAIFKLI